MNNKADIEEAIKILKEKLKQWEPYKNIKFSTEIEKEISKENQAIENILADRERLIIEKEIQEENYENLNADVSNIAKKLDLQEDATIDEIHIAIRILKSKRTNMFEYIDKLNKYDSLVEKIEEIRQEHINNYNNTSTRKDYWEGSIDTDREILKLLKGE